MVQPVGTGITFPLNFGTTRSELLGKSRENFFNLYFYLAAGCLNPAKEVFVFFKPLNNDSFKETSCQLIQNLEQCNEDLSLYQLLLDDARSRGDSAEIFYFRNELMRQRHEKRRLLSMVGGGAR